MGINVSSPTPSLPSEIGGENSVAEGVGVRGRAYVDGGSYGLAGAAIAPDFAAV